MNSTERYIASKQSRFEWIVWDTHTKTRVETFENRPDAESAANTHNSIARNATVRDEIDRLKASRRAPARTHTDAAAMASRAGLQLIHLRRDYAGMIPIRMQNELDDAIEACERIRAYAMQNA